MASSLTKAERRFIKDGLTAGAPKPFITSLLWVARKLGIEPNYMELNQLAVELDDEILGEPKSIDRRSSQG
jgi:hypothetical protein